MVSKQLKLEDTVNTNMVMFKLSKVLSQAVENKRDLVEIKREDTKKELEASLDNFTLSDLKVGDKFYNLRFERINVICSEPEMSQIGRILRQLGEQKLYMPVVLRLNSIMYKNEAENKKNNKKSKNMKLT